MWQQIQKERMLMQGYNSTPQETTLSRSPDSRIRQNETELARSSMTSHHITSQLEPLMESQCFLVARERTVNEKALQS